MKSYQQTLIRLLKSSIFTLSLKLNQCAKQLLLYFNIKFSMGLENPSCWFDFNDNQSLREPTFMKTLKLKIKNKIDVSEWCENYSYMFRKLYANFELSEDKAFQKELREKYNLDSWFFASCLMQVKEKIQRDETRKNKNIQQISCLQKILTTTEFKGRKARKRKFKIIQKLNYLEKHKEKGITFGGLRSLRKISYLSNKIKQITDELELDKTEKELLKSKKQYQNQRITQIVSIGDTAKNSNRKFNFDLINKKIVFKPNRNIKIPIEFYCSKKQHKELCELQKFIGKQPINVKLNNDYIYIDFDKEKLNGFSFNEREYFTELKTIPKQEKEKRKNCYIKWIQEQESRKFKGKNINRYIGIDLNPEHIGFAILEKSGEKNKIIHTECIEFTALNTNLHLSNTDSKSIYQNNKRKYELYEAWKHIFKVATHFQVSCCVIEDLEFKEKGVNSENKGFNRKTKNLWLRKITTNAIQKYCDELGIELIKVNSCYSSFIGNIQNNFFDPVAAAIEIARRGITKYLKGSFYPSLERSDLDTMYRLGLDVQNKTISTWVDAFKRFKTAGLRYRRELQNFVENNLLSRKSCVKIYNFVST